MYPREKVSDIFDKLVAIEIDRFPEITLQKAFDNLLKSTSPKEVTTQQSSLAAFVLTDGRSHQMIG